MKTLFQILSIGFFTLSISAQSTTPPDPPAPPTSENSNTSVSTSKSDNSLRFKARWSNKSRYSKLKAYLEEQLGEDGLTINGSTYKWSKESDAFNCKLTNKTMSLNLDYTQASKSLKDQVDGMMDNLKYAMGNNKPEDKIKRAQKEIEKAKRDIEKAKRDIERAKRDIERVRIELKRRQGNQISRVERRREEIAERKIEREIAIKERKQALQTHIKRRIEQKETIKELRHELEKIKEKEQ